MTASLVDLVLGDLGLDQNFEGTNSSIAQRIVAASNFERVVNGYAVQGYPICPSMTINKKLFDFVEEIADKGERGYSAQSTTNAIRYVTDTLMQAYTDPAQAVQIYEKAYKHLCDFFPLLEARPLYTVPNTYTPKENAKNTAKKRS